MTTRWQDWVAAASVLILTVVLVLLDLTAASVRHWEAEHAFTTAVLSGVLVLALTVLIADRVVEMRKLADRSRAIAAQAAILVTQAARATKSVSSMFDGSGDRDAASDEVRTYMTMLLICAPLLIDARLSRDFLEDAQHLGAELARALMSTADPVETSSARLQAAVERARCSAGPLLAILKPEQRTAVASGELGSVAP